MILNHLLINILIFASNFVFISSLTSNLLINNNSALKKVRPVKKLHMSNNLLPELVVFDLDMCLWHPEMYTLTKIPSESIIGDLGDGDKGVIGVMSGREVIQLFPTPLKVLRKFYKNEYPGMRIAAASSADTPLAVQIGRTALSMLEIFPGVTVREVFAKGWPEGFEGNLQIGRTPPLSSEKHLTHFPILQSETQIAYNKMLFFDDCNWGDHCANVEKFCTGVVTQKTPRGLQESEWLQGLEKYNKLKA